MISSGSSGPARTSQPTLLVFLFVTAVLAYVDRQFITVAVEALHADLGLSDIQIGLLCGPSFSLCFAIVGLPISILVDRYDRSLLLSLAMVCWSAATIACGFAENFTELFIARTFVGIGEAALAPAAYSLIGDYFEPEAVPRTTGVYSAGIAFGSGLAVLGGGPLIAAFAAHPVYDLRSWQTCFVLFGLLGLPLAFLWRHCVKDIRSPHAPSTERDKEISPLAFFGKNRALLLPLLVAACLHQMFNSGFMAWAPSFFMRTYGWTAKDTGILFGSAITLFSIIAAPLAGHLSAKLEKRGLRSALPLFALFSFCGLALVTVIGSLASNWVISVVSFALMPLFSGGVSALVPGILVIVTPSRLRGRMLALFLFFMTTCGYSTGPVLYAAVTEHLLGGRENLYLSLAAVTPCILIPAVLAMFLVARRYRGGAVVAAAST